MERLRIDVGDSTRKRISSVDDAMNARFPDQFRTAIEVREIGNPSRTTHRKATVHTSGTYHMHSLHFLVLLCLAHVDRGNWTKTDKRIEREIGRGGTR